MKARYSSGGNPVVLPVPWCMVIRGAQGFTSARWYEPDDAVGPTGLISFHDGRGLIVDPIYVAALFDDLQAWLPGLTRKTATASDTAPGDIATIAKLRSGTLVQCVDLHGNIYQSAPSVVTLVTKDGAGTQTGTVSASGLVTLNAGDHLDMASGDNGRLRWGWATNGTLARTQLVPPALPTTSTPPGSPAPSLPRQFYRVAIVDTTWALLGNRTGSAVLGIAGDDQMIPSDVQPMVRDQVVIDYLVDGPDTLAAASAVLARTPQDMILAVSPVLDGTISVPTHVGVNAHWPAFPASSSTAPFPSPPASVKDGITAAWTAGNDVVVTIAADKAPDGAHIRIYPQQFVTIPAITQEPSFRRGDGGAAIAQAGHATLVLLPNPFALASGHPRPNPANLTMDIVAVPRQGTRKMWGAVSVPVASGPAAPPSDPFAGINGVAAMPAMFESVAPDPLFGIPTTVTPPGAAPSNVIQFGRALASETAPRQGPRLPTMGRLETILATGLSAGAGNPDLWEAVLTGER